MVFLAWSGHFFPPDPQAKPPPWRVTDSFGHDILILLDHPFDADPICQPAVIEPAMSYSPVLNVVIRTVRKAGASALRHFDRRDLLVISRKANEELVTTADVEVEREIIQALRKAYPKYGILAEESGGVEALLQEEWCWIIDPIDGTHNFAQGIPHFALSIALVQYGEVMAGVVFNPVMDELFAAERGRGAFLNDHRIRVDPLANLSQTLLATGFPNRSKRHVNAYAASLRELMLASGGIRRGGSAALDLAYTAAGRYHGFWEMQLSPWDLAAGILLVQEAGGYVSDFQGGKQVLNSGDVVAANPAIHGQMLEIIRQSGLAALKSSP